MNHYPIEFPHFEFPNLITATTPISEREDYCILCTSDIEPGEEVIQHTVCQNVAHRGDCTEKWYLDNAACRCTNCGACVLKDCQEHAKLNISSTNATIPLFRLKRFNQATKYALRIFPSRMAQWRISRNPAVQREAYEWWLAHWDHDQVQYREFNGDDASPPPGVNTQQAFIDEVSAADLEENHYIDRLDNYRHVQRLQHVLDSEEKIMQYQEIGERMGTDPAIVQALIAAQRNFCNDQLNLHDNHISEMRMIVMNEFDRRIEAQVERYYEDWRNAPDWDQWSYPPPLPKYH